MWQWLARFLTAPIINGFLDAAVKATLAVAPEQSLHMLKTIAKSREYPQAGDAGMTLISLERGIFTPT
jgi:hypothetical protein